MLLKQNTQQNDLRVPQGAGGVEMELEKAGIHSGQGIRGRVMVEMPKAVDLPGWGGF